MSGPRQFIGAVFSAVDAMDAYRFGRFLHPDCNFVFGNAAPVVGREAIESSLSQFFPMIKAIDHHVDEVFEVDGRLIAMIQVTYTRHDNSQLSCPSVTVWMVTDSVITDYRIFVDNSALFQSII